MPRLLHAIFFLIHLFEISERNCSIYKPKLIFLQAIKVLNDEVNCDITKIGGLVRNKVRLFFIVQFHFLVSSRDYLSSTKHYVVLLCVVQYTIL
jgi:hypothetical protein